MPDSASVLVVEDDVGLLDSLQFNLEQESHHVLTADSGERALQLFRDQQPDLLVLDLMLPGMSGMELCRIIRRQEKSDVPILVLTARGEEIDRVTGLDMGADDYVVKPFGMRELMARVRALLRRRSTATPEQEQEVITASELTIDRRRHEVTIAGRPVHLSPKEFDILFALASNPGRVMARDAILELVWGDDFYGDERTVDVHIRWIRKKIEPTPSEPQYIQTIRGVGYKFTG